MYAPRYEGSPITAPDQYGGHGTVVDMVDPSGMYGDVRVTIRTGDPAPRPPADPTRPTWGTVPTARVTVRCLPRHGHWRVPPARMLAALVDQHLAAAGGRLARAGRRYETDAPSPIEWRFAYPLTRVADGA